jgi:hypothetical protein
MTRAKWTGGVAQVSEYLLCKSEALSSSPSHKQKKKKKKDSNTNDMVSEISEDGYITLYL